MQDLSGDEKSRRDFTAWLSEYGGITGKKATSYCDLLLEEGTAGNVLKLEFKIKKDINFLQNIGFEEDDVVFIMGNITAAAAAAVSNQNNGGSTTGTYLTRDFSNFPKLDPTVPAMSE